MIHQCNLKEHISALCYERQAVIELEEHGSSSPVNIVANGVKSEQSHARFSIKSVYSSLTPVAIIHKLAKATLC